MGLDMYLMGVDHDDYVELAYWRKHPNLHGYIVNTFAGGIDECQKIDLNETDLRKIRSAVLNNELPVTVGFFFGKSYGDADERAHDLEVIDEALAFIQQGGKVFYQASW